MSSVLKKENAESLVYTHQPKAFQVHTTKVAKDFVSYQADFDNGFQIAEIVAEQAGVEALRKKNIEAQVEDTVLVRLKEIEEKAYEKAFDLGKIEGAEKAFQEKKDEIEANVLRIQEVLAALDNIKVDMKKSNEAEILKLIHIIASKIAIREIENYKEPLIEMLEQLTADVQGAESLVVYMNPDDLKFFEEMKAKDLKLALKFKRLKAQGDAAITPGGCRVDTDFGTVDGTIEQRIEKAWQIIAPKLPQPTRK